MRQMKKLLLTSIAALCLATGTAHAVEWQCGPHYVSTMVLHGWPGEEKARQCRDYHILAYPAYNQIRKQAGGKSDDEIGLPAKGFRWGLLPHPEFKGQCGLLYRGKPCSQYPIEAESEGAADELAVKLMSDLIDAVQGYYPNMTEKEINEISYRGTRKGFFADFQINTYHMMCPKLGKCGVVLDGSEENK